MKLSNEECKRLAEKWGSKEEHVLIESQEIWLYKTPEDKEDYEEICKDENCEKCKELPKILRGKVTHKFPDLIQSEITPVKEAFNI